MVPMKRHFNFLSIIGLVLTAVACNVLSPAARAPGGDERPVVTQVPTVESTALPATPATVVASPTATAEPIPTTGPAPAPTRDPNLPEWTMMLFLNAGHDLELAVLSEMIGIEAAGSSDQVNVLVPADAGELADFLIWGINNYPANRYALLLRDHGRRRIDSSAPDPSVAGDRSLSIPEVAQALERALAVTGLPKFDVVGFDAGLMGRLEVYTAIQPYAHYAVGSEALVPGRGWDYETLLRNLYARPQMETAPLVEQMVDDFIRYYTQVDPDDFVTQSAVDLNRLPLLTAAVAELALALSADPAYTGSAVGAARSGAEAFDLIYPPQTARDATIDLWHFAAILAQRSSDESVTAAARQLMAAVDEVVVAVASGGGIRQARGIAVTFPGTGEFLDAGFMAQSAPPHWENFLRTYYGAGLAGVARPELHIVQVLDSVLSVQKPAYVEVEIIGRDIESVILINGRYQPDGRLRLTQYDTLAPEPTSLPDGSQLYAWPDGVHREFFVWEAEATYLHDGTNGDYVVMWPTGYESSLYTVAGAFRRAGDDDTVRANLVFDTTTGWLARVWGYQSETESAPREIFPEAGDGFQISNFYLSGAGDIVSEPGVHLFFDSERRLAYDWRPLPSGDYFLGFSARNIAGEAADTFTDFTIANDNLLPGYMAYLDPHHGFQFLYPAAWYKPGYDEAQLYTSDLAGQTWLYLTLYPEAGRVTAGDLRRQTLEIFGTVDVLYEENVTIGGVPGLLTAYGYEGATGPQTGLLLAFVRDGLGFVVDLDGPVTVEEENLQIMRALLESWQFQPVGPGLQPGHWARLALDDFSISVPSDFTHQELQNGWHLLSAADQVNFLALRTDPESGEERPALARYWQGVAGQEARNFNAGEPYRFSLANMSWARIDFSYVRDDGSAMRGLILVTTVAGRDVVAWAEAPAAQFDHLESSVFLAAVADLSLEDR
jgi:hypothetical protein